MRTDGPERRRLSRRPTPGLAGRIGLLQTLHVLDLSAQGARVATREALAPGRRYDVRLASLDLTAAVARCALVQLDPDEDGARPTFEAGLAFDSLTPAQKRLLGQLARRAAAA